MRIDYVLLLASCLYIATVASAEPNVGDEMVDGSGSGCSWGSDDAGSSSSDGYDWTRCNSMNVNSGSSSSDGVVGSRSGSGSEDFDIDAGASGSSSSIIRSEGSTGRSTGSDNTVTADKTQSGSEPAATGPQQSSASRITPVVACIVAAVASALLA